MAATIPPTVLLTRPKAASERFAAQLDLPCVISPLMKTVWLSPEPVSDPDAFVFTSETGVAGWVRLHDSRGTAYCVGDRTAETARAAGFNAVSAGGDARDLSAMIEAEVPKDATLLHVRGAHVAADLGDRVIPYAVYEQTPQALLPDALALLGQERSVIVPLFSPRSAQLFLQNLPDCVAANLSFAAISIAVADEIAVGGVGSTEVADSPNASEMLRVIRSMAEAGSSA